MTKKELMDDITRVLEKISDQERFCKENGWRTEDYYAVALGYLKGSLEYWQADGDVVKMMSHGRQNH